MPWYKDYDINWDEEFQFEIDEELVKKLPIPNLQFVSQERWPNLHVKSRFRSEREAERKKRKYRT